MLFDQGSYMYYRDTSSWAKDHILLVRIEQQHKQWRSQAHA